MPRQAVHPGEILREDYMIPFGISANALSRALDVPPNRITQIIAEENPRTVTADTALRLARYFGTSADLWVNLQRSYDLAMAEAEHGAHIRDVVRPRAA